MGTTTTRLLGCFALTLAACAGSGGGDGGGDGGGGIEPPFGEPHEFSGNEALTCEHGPWTYRVIRQESFLEVECSAGGIFAESERGAMRWIETRPREYTSLDLMKNPEEWPAAECFLRVAVFSQTGLNSPTDITVVEVTISAIGTGAARAARLTSNNPSVAPAFEFADSECERKEW